MRVTAFRAALFAGGHGAGRAVVAGPDRPDSRGDSARRHGQGPQERDDRRRRDPKSRRSKPETLGRRDLQSGTLTVMPGMIDVHAHVGWHFDKDGRYAARPGTPAQEILYSAENAYVTLMAGFTTIQSPGQANDVELRDAIARGVLPGSPHPDVDPPDQRAQRHARRDPRRRSASSRPTAPTSSRSSRRPASATAASRR